MIFHNKEKKKKNPGTFILIMLQTHATCRISDLPILTFYRHCVLKSILSNPAEHVPLPHRKGLCTSVNHTTPGTCPHWMHQVEPFGIKYLNLQLWNIMNPPWHNISNWHRKISNSLPYNPPAEWYSANAGLIPATSIVRGLLLLVFSRQFSHFDLCEPQTPFYPNLPQAGFF